jgi:hypothetical protein
MPRRGLPASATAAEQLPADLGWKATPGTRHETLTELRAADQKLAGQYGWADKEKSKVRIPIDRAMELTVKEINSR